MTTHKNILALAIAAALSALSAAPSDAWSFSPQMPSRSEDHGSSGHAAFPYPIRAQASSSTVLYDQSGIADAFAPSQNWPPIYDAFDSEAADDFVVADPSGWTVTAFNFQVDFGGTPVADAAYDIRVYADANGIPGAVACAYARQEGALDPTGRSLSVPLVAPCLLGAGRYWVSLVGDFSPPVHFAWNTEPGPAIDNVGVWREPLDGDITGCTSWTSMSGCVTDGGAGSTVGAGESNLLFQIIGTVGADAGCKGNDICLMSTVGTDLSSGACGVSKAIDATVGDQVNFCYTITNNTGRTLDYHSLANNVEGRLFQYLPHSLPAGASYQYNRVKTVGESFTSSATWSASDVLPAYQATVESGEGCADRIFADAFGDSISCPGGGFVDISETGIPIPLGPDSSVEVLMPFSFDYFDVTSNVLSISNNGGILFGTPSAFLSFLNMPLPAGSLAAPAILPLWDDFDTDSGDVYIDSIGVAPNRRFVVEWFQRSHFTGNTDSATFEVIFNEADGTLEFEYADVDYTAFNNGVSGDPDVCDDGLCATIGLQATNDLYVQYSAFEAAVTSHTGLKWRRASPQVFTSTDTVTVNVGAPQLVVNPQSIVGSVAAGGSTVVPFSIENHGNRDLNWSLSETTPSTFHFAPPGTRFALPMGDPARASAGPIPAALRTHAPRTGSVNQAADVAALAATPAFDEFQMVDLTTYNGLATIGPAQGTAFLLKFLDGDLTKAYGIDRFGTMINTFATIDATDGTITPIGTSVASVDDAWTGFAEDPTTGTLYASASTCGAGSHLYTIDRNTGEATLVGEMSDMSCAIWIAIGPDGLMYSVDVINDALYAVDKTTGATSLKGSVGFDANYAQDADFDLNTGILYWAAFNGDTQSLEFRTVDVDTGATSLIYSLPGLEIVGLAAQTIGGPCLRPQDLPWLTLAPLAGTTAPSDSTPITATIDAAAASPGDVLAGTICATSNDPMHHRVATPISVDVTP